MNIDGTPKVIFSYTNDNNFLKGKGSQIPVFIGYTGNNPSAYGLKKFRDYTEASKIVSAGGIGPETENNILLKTIKKFFTEVRKVKVDDITVPYIYVIDLGVKEPELSLSTWADAIELSKNVYDAQVEVYTGFNQSDTPEKIIPIINTGIASAIEYAKGGLPREIYGTVFDADQDQIKEYTNDNNNYYVQSSWFGLIRPEDFGKVIGVLCCTPTHEEPGYYNFRTIESGTYNTLSDEEAESLQSSGIIFINDENAGTGGVVTRINLAVSTSFASTDPPNDALLHHRRNVNQLVRDLYPVIFKQLKRNETKVNRPYLRTDVNAIINEYRSDGKMQKGTVADVVEVSTNPYTLAVRGTAVPVNSTLKIDFTMYVDTPNAIGGE